MPHVHPDRLIELAVTGTGTLAECDHLDECAECRSQVSSVRYVAEMVTAADEVRTCFARRMAASLA